MKRALLFLLLPVFLRAEEEVVTPIPPVLEDDETRLEEPPPLNGDVRVRVRTFQPLPSVASTPPILRHRPYFSQRYRLNQGHSFRAGALLIRPSPGPSWNSGDLRRFGTEKGFVEKPGVVVAGDYRLAYGLGLVFYDQPGEFIRPVWIDPHSPTGDLGSAPGGQLRGAAARVPVGPWAFSGFLSRLSLNARTDDAGIPDGDLMSLRQVPVSPTSASDLRSVHAEREDMGGGRAEVAVGPFVAGVTVARYRYLPALNDPKAFVGALGPRQDVGGADVRWKGDGVRWQMEAAHSRNNRAQGAAWAGTVFSEKEGVSGWITLFDYDKDYGARHAGGPGFDLTGPPESLTRNQRGFSVGTRRASDEGYVEADAAWALFPTPLGDGSSVSPPFPSRARRWRLEAHRTLEEKWEIIGRLQERVRERFLSPTGGGSHQQGDELVRKARAETRWRASPHARLTLRYDARWERVPFAGQRAEGHAVMVEVKGDPSRNWSAAARAYAFRSPSADMGAGLEEIWNGVVASQLAGGMGSFRGAPGERWVFQLERHWGTRASVWLKTDAVHRWRGSGVAGARRGWHMEGMYRF